MADKKITELVELVTAADNDWTVIVDVSDTTMGADGTTKKVLKSELKGDTGDAATVDVGTTTTGSPGTDASVVNSGTTSAAIFDFTIPRGATGADGAAGTDGLDITWKGAYSGATAYVVNDAVSYNGSSYICKLNSTNNLPTNTTYWDLMAQKGDAGAGSGDVSKVGTPLNNQVGVWTGDGTLEGDAALTFDTTTDTLTSGILNATSLTASEIAITDASKNIVSAPVATYPSLTELTYVKGVTSAIQTQIGTKAPTANPTFTGTVILPKTIEIQDTSADHQYVLAVNELTADRTVTLPLLTGNDEITFNAHTQTLTNKRITKRVASSTDDATAVIDVDTTDVYELTAMANATTISTTGTPTDGQKLMIRLKDNGTGRALTWDAVFVVIGVTAPTTTVAGKWHYIGCQYNSGAAKWHIIAVGAQA